MHRTSAVALDMHALYMLNIITTGIPKMPKQKLGTQEFMNQVLKLAFTDVQIKTWAYSSKETLHYSLTHALTHSLTHSRTHPLGEALPTGGCAPPPELHYLCAAISQRNCLAPWRELRNHLSGET